LSPANEIRQPREPDHMITLIALSLISLLGGGLFAWLASQAYAGQRVLVFWLCAGLSIILVALAATMLMPFLFHASK
jgi:amino acid transporter